MADAADQDVAGGQVGMVAPGRLLRGDESVDVAPEAHEAGLTGRSRSLELLEHLAAWHELLADPGRQQPGRVSRAVRESRSRHMLCTRYLCPVPGSSVEGTGFDPAAFGD